MKDIKTIFKKLKSFGIFEQSHTEQDLVRHLEGTYRILKSWDCSEDLCLAGLCHSIYGTESYTKQTVPLEERELVQKLIGDNAEELVYYFGAHVKNHFWELLDKEDNFEIKDRFSKELISVTREVINDLVTLTLANWLEQRPRVDKKYHFIRKEEFLASKRFLPKIAYKEFKIAYELIEERK